MWGGKWFVSCLHQIEKFLDCSYPSLASNSNRNLYLLINDNYKSRYFFSKFGLSKNFQPTRFFWFLKSTVFRKSHRGKGLFCVKEVKIRMKFNISSITCQFIIAVILKWLHKIIFNLKFRKFFLYPTVLYRFHIDLFRDFVSNRVCLGKNLLESPSHTLKINTLLLGEVVFL